eukprot:scaffold193_cov255-Pinguiococcus_pyrenoidosus.AAC.35
MRVRSAFEGRRRLPVLRRPDTPPRRLGFDHAVLLFLLSRRLRGSGGGPELHPRKIGGKHESRGVHEVPELRQGAHLADNGASSGAALLRLVWQHETEDSASVV